MKIVSYGYSILKIKLTKIFPRWAKNSAQIDWKKGCYRETNGSSAIH